MKKYDKEKLDKIKQNNANDFGLAYEYLVNGASWDDYKQAMQDRSMP